MPSITLNFNEPLNVSVQVGDAAYYVGTSNVGIHPSAPLSNVKLIGNITGIIPWNGTISGIVVWMSAANFASPGPPPVGSFIMFSKDNKANLSSILGYYAEVVFRNNSSDEAEIFGVGVGFSESSK